MDRRELLKLSVKSCAIAGASLLIVDRRAVFAAGYTGPVCRMCVRENMKLFLKGERCFTAKCKLERQRMTGYSTELATLVINILDSNTKLAIADSNVYIFTSASISEKSCGDCHGPNEGALSHYPNKLWNGKYEHLDDDITPFSTNEYGSITTILECDTKFYIVVNHPRYRQELFGSLTIKDPTTYTYDISLDPISFG